MIRDAVIRSTVSEFVFVARSQTLFVCRDCGGESLKWQGQCAHCKAWDTLERMAAPRSNAARGTAAQSSALESASLAASAQPRMSLRLTELDRVFGGGLLPGSGHAAGREPGIASRPAAAGSGNPLAGSADRLCEREESMSQVALRAQRLGLTGAQLELIADSSLDAICRLPPNGAARCW